MDDDRFQQLLKQLTNAADTVFRVMRDKDGVELHALARQIDALAAASGELRKMRSKLAGQLPQPTDGMVKVRAAVAVDDAGEWYVCGGSRLSDEDTTEQVCETVSDNNASYFIESLVPRYTAPTVFPGKVVGEQVGGEAP